MESRLDHILFHWTILRIFSVAWILLTMGLTLSFYPQSMLGIGALSSILATILAASAISTGDKARAMLSIAIANVVFFLQLAVQIVSKTVDQTIHVTLLEFVMLLFATEVISVVTKRHSLISKGQHGAENTMSISIMQRSLQSGYAQLSRLALLFGGGYLTTLAVSYAATFASFATLLGDLSLYVVVVTVSLALILVLREKQA